MLWYAREAALLVHVGEAIALVGSDEREALKAAYTRLAAVAEERELPAVQRFFADEIHRSVGSKVEALMSALWRLQTSALELFSLAVREMVVPRQHRQRYPRPQRQRVSASPPMSKRKSPRKWWSKLDPKKLVWWSIALIAAALCGGAIERRFVDNVRMEWTYLTAEANAQAERESATAVDCINSTEEPHCECIQFDRRVSEAQLELTAEVIRAWRNGELPANREWLNFAERQVENAATVMRSSLARSELCRRTAPDIGVGQTVP